MRELRCDSAAGLALLQWLRRVAGSGRQEAHLAEVGLSELEEFTLIEVDDRGRWTHVELFAPDRLGDALVRLYQRYAEQLPEGPVRARVERVARTIAAQIGPADLEAIANAYDPSYRCIDHRVFGTWNARDRAEMLQHFRLQLEIAPDFASRYDDLLALEVDAIAAGMTYFGTGRDSGGPFENRLCIVFGFGEDGRSSYSEVFEAEQVDAALARFAEIEPYTSTTTATAATQRAWAVFDAGDFDAARALCAPGFRWEDRRPLVGLSGDVELMIASARERLASGARHQHREIIGTAGDRVVIGRILWAGGPAEGRFEVEFLVVSEVDANGLCTAMIFLDPDDLSAAQREAESRCAALERPDPLRIPPNAATHANDRWIELSDAGDWDALRQLVAPGTFEDRRPMLRTQGDLESIALGNTRYAWSGGRAHPRRTLLATAGDRLALEHVLWTSSDDVPAFEVEILQLTEVDAEGRVIAYLFFDPSDRVAASTELFERYAASGADDAPAAGLEA